MTIDDIVAPLRGIEPAQLRRVASQLADRGGEYRACGLVLEAAIAYVYPDAPKPQPKKKVGFEKAYGGRTFP